MRGGVVAARGAPERVVDLELDLVAHGKRARFEERAVQGHFAERPLRVDDARGAASPADDATVTDLAARLGVERRARDGDLDLVAWVGALDDAPLIAGDAHQGEHIAGVVLGL